MNVTFVILTSLIVVGVKAISKKFLNFVIFMSMSKILELDGFDNRILQTRFFERLYCCKGFITFPPNINGRDYLVTSRMDEDKNLIHIEVREQFPVQSNQGLFMNPLTFFVNQFTSSKPIIAKTGYRPDSTLSTENLDIVLMNEFNEVEKQVPIAIFVYMWVAPEFRGKGFGDFLLQRVIKECIDRGDKYMIIVHDDNGSGKLIEYYKKRNFREIFEFLDKGMICKFPASLPTFEE